MVFSLAQVMGSQGRRKKTPFQSQFVRLNGLLPFPLSVNDGYNFGHSFYPRWWQIVTWSHKIKLSVVPKSHSFALLFFHRWVSPRWKPVLHTTKMEGVQSGSEQQLLGDRRER